MPHVVGVRAFAKPVFGLPGMAGRRDPLAAHGAAEFLAQERGLLRGNGKFVRPCHAACRMGCA